MNGIFSKSLDLTHFLLIGSIIVGLGGCESIYLGVPSHLKPVGSVLEWKMEQRDMDQDAPIMVRIFKEENELEVWKKNRSGKYGHLSTFAICAWSGNLGPKFKEGDRQSPEGFYSVGPQHMNPNSSYHLSFNMGYPNSYDKAHRRTGSHLMVHGACSSRGCYAMEDPQIEKIYALARDAFKGGQKEFQVQAYPFRMTAANLAPRVGSPHFEFWKNLKEGYDHFEISKVPPKVNVCEKTYVFNATPDKSGRHFHATSQCPEYSIPTNIETALTKQKKRDKRVFDFELAKFESQKNSPLLAMVNTNSIVNHHESELDLLQNSNEVKNDRDDGSPTTKIDSIGNLIEVIQLLPANKPQN